MSQDSPRRHEQAVIVRYRRHQALALLPLWLLAAVGLGTALTIAQCDHHPLDDPDLAMQRPGFLDAHFVEGGLIAMRRIVGLTLKVALTLVLLACSGVEKRAVSLPVPSETATVNVPFIPEASATPVKTPTAASGYRSNDLLVTRDQALTLRDLRSGKERTLISASPGQVLSYPAWSPDGQQFAFVLQLPFPGGQIPLTNVGNEPSDWGSDLYLADANGANRRLLVQHDHPGVQVQAPTWTADGRALLFSYLAFLYDAQGRYQNEVYEVRKLDLATGSVTPVVDNAVSADLCPDGSNLVYVRFDPASNSRIAVVVADASGREQRVLLTNSAEAQAFLYPRFSPDCQRIVFAAVNAGLTYALPSKPPSLLDRLLAFASPATAAAHGAPWELWSVNTDGSGLQRLTHLAADEPCPVWSADGLSIVFIATGGLYQMDRDGMHLKRLSDGVMQGQVAWRQQ